METEERRAKVYVGFGANLGEPVAQIRDALEALEKRVQWDRVSSVYRTEPEGFTDQPDFYNLVASGLTDLAPESLLGEIEGLEETMGRARTFRNAPRLIDIDLLSHGQRVTEGEPLILPHPRLHLRGFVLVPLVEIAPDWVHPALGVTATELLRDLGSSARIERWGTLPRPGAGHEENPQSR